ncbi:MAG: hypothetical protein IJY29_03985 [Ruminococcus sp.]|nr:hypothetical protein [Bacillota bacterium]MBQ4534258.1 hypothetical protein [Ruminococcus sp.]MBQ9078718.1 hypothetical protein [Ruminococcus sp.]
MKLTYRDKVILAIVLALFIFVGGFFGLIKPKRQDIKDNTATLETLEKDKKEIERKIARIEKVEKNIHKTFDESKKNTAVFVDEEKIKEPKLLDNFMYKYAENAHVKVTELKVDPIASSALNYYYEPYVEVATALRENADINGSLREKVSKESADSSFISSRGVENIMTTRYGITFEGTKKEIWAYLAEIEDIDSAVLITSLAISEVKEEEEEDKKATPAGAEGENAQQQEEQEKEKDEDQAENWEDDTLLEANAVIQLYSVYEMEEPKTEMQKD